MKNYYRTHISVIPILGAMLASCGSKQPETTAMKEEIAPPKTQREIEYEEYMKNQLKSWQEDPGGCNKRRGGGIAKDIVNYFVKPPRDTAQIIKYLGEPDKQIQYNDGTLSYEYIVEAECHDGIPCEGSRRVTIICFDKDGIMLPDEEFPQWGGYVE